MSARHAVLSVGALVVLGLGVYLFVAVRAESAAPPPAAPPPVAERAAPPAAPPSESRPAAPAAPAARMPGWIPSHPGAPASAPSSPPPPTIAADPAGSAGSDDPSGTRLDLVMDEANKAYDRGDYDDAKIVAGRVLARQPANIRMLRIMVSASCIDGDSAAATASFAKLPASDQAQMRTRCARYGVTFPEK